MKFGCASTLTGLNCRNRCFVSDASGTSSPSLSQRPLTAIIAPVLRSSKVSALSPTRIISQLAGGGGTEKLKPLPW